jgi:hypothetical protein
MPTVWWDDPRQYRIDPGSGTFGGSVPEAVSRSRWSDWDKMAIGDFEVPGHVVVVSKKEKKMDVLSVAGQDGATINHLGIDPVQLDITITLWTPDQFADYERLIGLLTPKSFPGLPKPLPPGVSGPPEDPTRPTSASSFSVRHPPLNMMGVTEIYIYEIGSLIPGAVFGSKVSVWRAQERKPTQQMAIHAASGAYAPTLAPAPVRPAATQPTTKPSAAGIPP